VLARYLAREPAARAAPFHSSMSIERTPISARHAVSRFDDRILPLDVSHVHPASSTHFSVSARRMHEKTPTARSTQI
jgi:hypothetical protein